MLNPFSIGISGDSGAGEDTLATDDRIIGKENSTHISRYLSSMG